MEKEQIREFFKEIGLAKGIVNIKKFEREILIPEIIKAKKEVFDELEKHIQDRDDNYIYFETFMKRDEWDKIKKRHLSTLEKPKQHNSGLKKDRHQ